MIGSSSARSLVAFRLSWLVLGLAACSPYGFSKEITAFSQGVDSLSSGFADGYAQLAADREAVLELDLTGARAPVAISPSCSDARINAPCLVFKRGAAEPKATPIEGLRGPTIDALTVLGDYAHALAAVSNAGDRADFDKAVAQLSGSIGQLAQFADAAAPGTSAAAPAVVSFAGWVFGTALDQQRFDSLKAAVTAAGTAPPGKDSPIAAVTKRLGAGLVALRDQRAAVAQQEVDRLSRRLQPSLSDSDYRQGLSDLKAAVAVQYGLTQSDPTETATALAQAHDALLAALEDPKRNYPALLKAVNDFASQATALRNALAAAGAPTPSASQGGS